MANVCKATAQLEQSAGRFVGTNTIQAAAANPDCQSTGFTFAPN